ncbi:hypothetical protein [Spirobacillus cienkowskii]|uniref:hypothetical protein n=1 Tax=Spirobacillus cienkowskii TaxID=495820 RepID=UPI0030D2335A
MTALFHKDENLMSSPPVLGYHVLMYMEKKKSVKISIFDVADHFKNEWWFNSKNLYFAMFFLFSLDIIDFEHSYIIKRATC